MSVTGDRIKKRRELMGLTQLELANKIDINNSVLSRIEAGKRPVEDNELIRFSDFFDVDSDYLLGRTDTPRSDKQGFMNSNEQAEFEAFINNPEYGIFFKDYLSAPEERRREMWEIWRVLRESEKDRKPGQRQGE
ncbi:HTH-type transcriptional regulator ImmR [compost metagenome]